MEIFSFVFNSVRDDSPQNGNRGFQPSADRRDREKWHLERITVGHPVNFELLETEKLWKNAVFPLEIVNFFLWQRFVRIKELDKQLCIFGGKRKSVNHLVHVSKILLFWSLVLKYQVGFNYPNTTGFCGHKRKPPIEEATKRLCNQLA